MVVVNRILFRFGFGRNFRPKYVLVSAFRLSSLSAIWPKEGALAEMTFGQKRMLVKPPNFDLSSSFQHVSAVLVLFSVSLSPK